MPKIPSGTKKSLKRNINDPNQSLSSGKKRATSENSPQKNHQLANRQQYPHITANSPQTNSCTASVASENKKQQQQAAAQYQNNQHLQKQRYFHHKQQLTKQKMAKKANAAAAAAAVNNHTSNKRQATPAKSGRRANQKLLLEHQQMALKQMQLTEQQSQSMSPSGAVHVDLTTQPVGSSVLTQQQSDMQFLSYATQNVPPQQILMDEQSAALASAQAQLHVLPSANQAPAPATLVTPLSSTSASSTPQIAASKRDISKNLNKLQQMQQNQIQTNTTPPSAAHTGSPTFIPSHDIQTSLGTIISSSSAAGKTPEKSLISTTPVQKYIVEERQPGVSTAPGSIVSLQNAQNASATSATNLQSAAHIIQVSNASVQQSQIMALPQFSAAATKLRAVNTTLIAPGAKISPTTNKKITTITSPLSPINAGALHELANVASTQSQVLHIVETSQAGGNSNNPTNTGSTFTSTLHTPPAVIQIQNNNQSTGGGVASGSDIAQPASTQSKVLTTTILPLVLSGSCNANPISSSAINNTSIILGSSPTTPGSGGGVSMSSIVSSASSTTTTTGTTTIIKNLPSTMVLNANTTTMTPVTLTGTIFSTLGAGATVFRKPQNLIKTSAAATSTASKSPTSGGPHILSNVKLTPMNVTTSTAGTSLCSTNPTFKNVLPSTSSMVRASVKICQSPNGKVLIQPAGLVDGSKMKLNTSSLPHKILPNASATTGTVTSASGGGGGQRIAIQKVQIIPAPLGSPAGTTTIQTAGSNLNAKTSTLSGKSNMIFMPTSGTTNVRPVTLSKMGNNILLKSSANTQLVTSPDGNAAKANIVVLGQSIQSQATSTTLKDSLNQKLEINNSFINEDAPLDILNMPIVMAGVPGASTADTVTVLSGGNIMENNSNTTTSATPIIVEQAPQQQSSSTTQQQQTVILGATDWEMELDQAITTAHNNSAATQYQKPTIHRTKRTVSTSSSNSSISLSSLTTSSSGNKQKQRINNELVSIELKTNRPSPLTSQQLTTLPSVANNNIIVVDSFDDVIVEEHEDDLSSSNVDQVSSAESNSTIIDRQNEDQPKILDMQIYQQHDGGIDGAKSQISIVGGNHQSTQPDSGGIQTSDGAQQSTVETNQRQERRHQHPDCEVDAGFDETIGNKINILYFSLLVFICTLMIAT